MCIFPLPPTSDLSNGTVVRIVPKTFDNRTWTWALSGADVMGISDNATEKELFRVISPGLLGTHSGTAGTISLQIISLPNHYVVRKGYGVGIEQRRFNFNFWQRASWFAHRNRFGFTTFESAHEKGTSLAELLNFLITS